MLKRFKYVALFWLIVSLVSQPIIAAVADCDMGTQSNAMAMTSMDHSSHTKHFSAAPVENNSNCCNQQTCDMMSCTSIFSLHAETVFTPFATLSIATYYNQPNYLQPENKPFYQPPIIR